MDRVARWTGSASGSRPRSVPYFAATLVVVLCTLVVGVLFQRLDLRNLALVYLLGVVFVATRYGRGPSVLASCLGVAAFEFFYTPPYWSFRSTNTQDLFTLAFMVVVALLTSGLASQVREQAEEADQRGRRMQVLYALTRELAHREALRDIAETASTHLSQAFKVEARVLLSDENGGREVPAGREWLLAPLPGGSKALGLAALRLGAGVALPAEASALLEAMTSQIALSLERAGLAAQAERARIEMEREQLRSALLSSVSHDLRTPLSAITGAASSLMTDQSLPRDVQRELSAMIYEESGRLNRQVGNLLDMTRLQSQSLRVNKELHSLEEIVGSALRRLSDVLRRHRVRPGLPADLPLVPLDASLVEQVFVNLLENAAKYTPEGSAVDIVVAPDADHVTIEVGDTGPGIPPGDEDLLFEKFYRGKDSGDKGVGLGLTICRAIVTAHGGRIWAENRSGGGAVFRFTLPLDGCWPVVAPSEAPR